VEIEAGGTQKSVAQYTRRQPLSSRPGHFMNVIDFVPNRDKLDTATAALVACEAGRVWFPGAGADRLCLPAQEKSFPLAEVEGRARRLTRWNARCHREERTAAAI